ncbi:hypothetical protein HLB23_34990 [Nocardia uniformis]|uniref:Uncharacterized protein n=1 Tax=Nocardia uniformis TaxID=53432 RepID=A0A849CED6_9NOCA|nr:hypothetical protein [Nocardia uniformis]NNH75000.1 hypothetical protein [Nocardia uniformis]
MPNLDANKSADLRNKIQLISEEVAALLGAEHPAAVSLQRAAAELAAAAPVPRRYADYQQKAE